jgi:hypothetical protein
MQYSLTYRLGGFVGDGISRTISGFAYPGETLTSTVAGQWFVNNVAVVGETGATYVVNLLDIGKSIRCGSSNALTCWKPQDIAGVAAFWWSRGGVLNAIDPDTMATDGQTVRRWADNTSPPFNANQTVGESQPIYRATGQSGGPSIEFDGSNDTLSVNKLDVYRAIEQGYLFVGCRDTNRTGGDIGHAVSSDSTGTSTTQGRLGINTRGGSSSVFRGVLRRNDSDTALLLDIASDSNYNVLSVHGNYAGGLGVLRKNGVQQLSQSLPGGSGPTSDTNSLTSDIGSIGSGNHFPGHITCIIKAAGMSAMSATDLSRIERFIGLQGGLNIPLV